MLAMEAGGVIEALAAGPAFPTLLVTPFILLLATFECYTMSCWSWARVIFCVQLQQNYQLCTTNCAYARAYDGAAFPA